MNRRTIATIALACLVVTGRSTVINGYAEVTAMAGASLTIGVSNETGALFNAGGYLVLMQMQDNVIGGNTSNTATFGDLATIGAVGQFEKCTILSVTRVGPVLTGITLTAAPKNTFSIGANSTLPVATAERPAG